jgi:hypothetical protein
MPFIGPQSDPDKYELHELRSRGGEGEVWRGTMVVEGSEVPVAVKQILPGREGPLEAWRDRWSRQAEVLRSLSHPGLVTVREFFEGAEPHERGEANDETSTLYLTMNWVEGPTLTEWVSRKPDRDVLESLRVVGGLAAAVDYLHSGGNTTVTLLHRDIKPSNVIITERGPTLVDFGFVRGMRSEPSGSIVGTPHYIAPEVAAGLGATEASDRYALGATAYFAVTGEIPDTSDLDGLYRRMDAVPGLTGRRDVQDHLLAMMHPDPLYRPASAVEWAQGLATMSLVGGANSLPPSANAVPGDGTVRRAAPPQQHTPPPPQHTPPPLALPTQEPARKGRRLALVGGAVALLAAVSVGALALTQASQSRDAEAAPSVAAATESDETVDLATVDEPREVPDLVGEDASDARTELEAAGWEVSVVEQDAAGPAGRVVEQDPEAGTELASGQLVTLSISRAVEAPDLVGMSLDDATGILDSYGADVDVETVYDRSVDADTVLSQSIAPGSVLAEEIELTVSEGAAAIYLEKLRWVGGDAEHIERIGLGGTTFLRNIGAYVNNWSNNVRVEYNLSRDFDAMVATVGYDDDSPADGRVRLEVFADNEKVYEEDFGLGTVRDFDLDVTDVLRLRVEWTLLEGDEARVAFGEPELVADPAVIDRYERQSREEDGDY